MPKPPPTPMSEWARTARRAAGFTSAEKAAKALGLDPGYLRLLEAGHIGRPRPERLALIEKLYGSTAPEPDIEPGTPDVAEVIAALDQIAHELRHLAQAQSGYSEALLALLAALAPEAAEALLRLGAQTDPDTPPSGGSDPAPSRTGRGHGAGATESSPRR